MAVVALLATMAVLVAPARAQTPAPNAASETGTTGHGGAAASPDTVVEAGPEYAAGWLQKTLLGRHYRELWTAPVRVPVLDLDSFGGGLEVDHAGGNQSRTLHFNAADGREYVFRSVNKFAANAIPHDLGHSPVGWVVQDQISSLNPAASLVLPPLLQAAGILHVQPRLVLMPDDPRLGRFRQDFAGLLGEVEVKPDEGAHDAPGFAGSRKIVSTSTLYEDLEDSPDDQVDQRELAAARLIDFLVGDPDRGTDQWRWARYEKDGVHVWRPIPRDRDWAFVDADGALAELIRTFYPKLVSFGHDYPPIDALTFSSHALDRRLLTGLDRADWDSIAVDLQRQLSDRAIAEAVAAMPPSYRIRDAALLAERLRDRRALLPQVADRFYRWLATDVDVRGTDEADLAEVERLPDGRVEVSLYGGSAQLAGSGGEDGDVGAGPRPYYHRVFLPEETREVRIFLHGGDDRAVVRGRSDRINVRLLGGGGDDVLADSSGAGGVFLYDSKDGHRFITDSGTHTDTRDWHHVEPPEGIRAGSGWAPDYGTDLSWAPVIEYREGSGVALGFGPSYTSYGFRRYPYATRIQALPVYAPGSGRAALDLKLDHRPENTALGLAVHARASTMESYRFYGYGNATPDWAQPATLVRYRELLLEPALVWHIGWRKNLHPLAAATGEEKASFDSAQAARLKHVGPALGRLAVGPVVRWIDPSYASASPLAALGAAGASSFGEVGGQARLDVRRTDGHAAPRRGGRLSLGAAAYPAVWDAAGAFGEARGEAAAYLPIPGTDGPSLALRAGGSRAFGAFPVQHAAYLGGRLNLRGYDYDRFAGDAAAYGSAELRAPLGEITLLTRGELGAFGFVDTGRVWMDGASPGGWHVGRGVGIWFSTLGNAVYLAWARGDETQVYLGTGLPF